jgi:hypothetical protein
MVSASAAFDAKLVVFATEDFNDLAILSSSFHRMWALKYGTTMRRDATYTPSALFETFPRPERSDKLSSIGRLLDSERREIMIRRGLGLTDLYNLVNRSDVTTDRDVSRIREVHVGIDESVAEAYGWTDVPLEHGFHTYRQVKRFTMGPAARVEILDRLLRENHRRAAVEAGGADASVDERLLDIEDELADEGNS